MIVSIHIPKCAGTSFRHMLEQVYGSALWLNYGDDFSFDSVPPGTECIHGHIPGDAYATVYPGHQVITMVRHPVQRVVSNYFHFVRAPDDRHPASRLLHQHKLSLLQFAEIETMRNKAVRYVAGRSPEDFDFVGITERFEESLEVFARTFSLPELPPVYHDNVNAERTSPTYPLARREYDAIAALNLGDLVWYQHATRCFDRALVDEPVRCVG